MNKNLKGFTLVELAIVLVIIGLLVGGVLQGQELIKQAQLRNVVRAFSEMDTALNTFRAKYNALPGDFAAATAFGVNAPRTGGANLAATPATAPGDGNGDNSLGEGTSFTTFVNWDGEMANFFVMLNNAELVKGSFTQATGCISSGTPCSHAVTTAYPSLPIGGGFIALTAGGQLNYVTGITGAATTAAMAASLGLAPQDAYSIDSKIDDGLPLTGIVQAIKNYTSGAFVSDTAAGGPPSTTCITSSANSYNTPLLTNLCTIRVRASG